MLAGASGEHVPRSRPSGLWQHVRACITKALLAFCPLQAAARKRTRLTEESVERVRPTFILRHLPLTDQAEQRLECGVMG